MFVTLRQCGFLRRQPLWGAGGLEGWKPSLRIVLVVTYSTSRARSLECSALGNHLSPCLQQPFSAF